MEGERVVWGNSNSYMNSCCVGMCEANDPSYAQ